jgi:hypothetical protein
VDRIQTVLHDAPVTTSVTRGAGTLLCQSGVRNVNVTG